MDPTSRSPSPSHPPPTASAPGPRAAAIQKLYADAIAHILRTCSYNNFASCFPTAAARVPGSVADLHRQFITHLGSSLAQNFEVILEDRKVVQSLNELDRLIDEARRRKASGIQPGSGIAPEGEETGSAQNVQGSVPLHTLPAQKLYLSHLAPTLEQYAIEMRVQQEALDAENQEVWAQIGRAHV